MYNRFRILNEAISSYEGKYSLDFIKRTNALVFIDEYSYNEPTNPPLRTLWHSIFDSTERSVCISFYLNDEYNQNSGRQELKYSDYFRFSLT